MRNVAVANSKQVAVLDVSATPPLPPRVAGRRQASTASFNPVTNKVGKKRVNSNSEFTPPTDLPPQLQRRPSQKSNKGEVFSCIGDYKDIYIYM